MAEKVLNYETAKLKYVLTCFLLFAIAQLSAQFMADVRHSVKLEASTSNWPPVINLSWVEDEGSMSYDVYRRDYPDGEWGATVATYSANINEYTDSLVIPGQLYEYRIIKINSDFDSLGYGYVLSGIELPPVHVNGGVLTVLTTTTAFEITESLAEYQEVLETDGWIPFQLIIPDDASVSEVKEAIVAAYDSAPFLAVLLLGDVPVPHSGDINPDAHTDMKGAWSADVYYGDLDGVWTDTEVTNTTSSNPRNHNVHGDERWDQSFIPSQVEVAVGRVDFSNMPAFTEDEYELLRQYLRKDVDYRRGDIAYERRAMIKNVNPWNGGLGQNGIRNFSTLVSPDSLAYDDWNVVFNESYQWFYGGCGGSHIACTQMGNTSSYANGNFQSIFTAWFGSRFGDYDFPDAYLRSHLGSGTVLSSVWAGAPHWHFHAMGMGFPLATSTVATQNNDTLYSAGYFPRSIHVNLLGDPTLKAYPFAGSRNLEATVGGDFIDLSWEEAAESVDGYYIYRRLNNDVAFDLIDSVGATAVEYRDYTLSSDLQYDYLIRAYRLETTASGSFYNLSAGELVEQAIILDTEEAETIETVYIFPNPAQERLHVRTLRPFSKLKLISSLGRDVGSWTGNDDLSLRIPTADQARGYYLLVIQYEDGTLSQHKVLLN